MTDKLVFTSEERVETMLMYSKLKERVGDSLLPDDELKIRQHLSVLMEHGQVQRDVFGLNPILLALQTAQILVDETRCCAGSTVTL